MDTMLYILIGFIIGTFLSNYVGFNKVVKAIEDLKGLPQQKKEDEPVQPKKLKGTGRKGLMEKSFTDQTTKESIDVEFEIYEIERSKTKSKIGIIGIHVDKGAYSGKTYKDTMTGMWDKSWVDIADIEWLDESQELAREDKLKDLLN